MAVLHLKSHIFIVRNSYQSLNQHLKMALLLSFIFISLGLPVMYSLSMKQETKFLQTTFFLTLWESLGIEKIRLIKKPKGLKKILQSSTMSQNQLLQLESHLR